ncbi:MAG TPA: hypothetical protein VN893_02045 [Bryobacteraceae bacterium]|nr:hypothetical protein [Bryobacteraceae bacterium]
MRSRLTMLVVGVAMLACVGFGATLSQQLGVQDFANGAIVGSSTFTGVSDVAPFNTVIGADPGGPNFAATWTFSGYGPVVGSVTSATLLIASWDFDTESTSVSHVLSFDMNGILLTGVLDAAFKADPNTANSQILWYTVALPSTTFAQLATGSATFDLTLQNGAGVLGPTTFNGGGMDFSTLTVNAAAPTPEPFTAVITMGGLAALALLRRKRAAA